jgi:CTP:phosphocholine cytidylyltransferase-like protein
VKLTTHLQLVPRSRKRGSIQPFLPPPPIRIHGAVVNLLSTGATLPFLHFTEIFEIISYITYLTSRAAYNKTKYDIKLATEY